MDLTGFALAVLLIELTPGPNMAWLAGLAATEGRRAGLGAVAGIAIGLLANGLLAALGLAALLSAEPGLWTALRVAGACMMLWLAIDAWRGSTTPAPPSGTPTRAHKQAFWAGLLINLLNPKAAIFFVVVAPQFLNGTSLTLPSAALLAVISAAIATAIHLAIVTAGASAQAWLNNPARTRTVRRLFAVLMLAIAASFLLPVGR